MHHRAACGLTTLLTLAGALHLDAQGLPPYASVNPMVFSRTGLATLPYMMPRKGWHISVITDYANSIEYASNQSVDYLLDAELLRAEVTVTRDLRPNVFVLVQGSVNGAYDGFLDGFLDWYHNLTGLHVSARGLRPTNQFGYQLGWPGASQYVFEQSRAYLGDLRLGTGFRHSLHWQTLVSVTIPTSTGPAGFRRSVVTGNASTVLRSNFGGGRFTYEGSLGVGYAPAHGDLAELQHTTFLMVSQGLRGRVAGPFHLYTNLLYHSRLYHDTKTPSLDRRELTLDVGGIFKFERGPEWILGMVQDLDPSGPAIDVDVRLGVRW
jgi:hypothetical protein